MLQLTSRNAIIEDVEINETQCDVICDFMTMDAMYEVCGSHWSQQPSTMVTTQWLQHDQTFPLSVSL